MLSCSLNRFVCSPRAGLLVASLSFGLFATGCSGSKEPAEPAAPPAEADVDVEEVSSEPAPAVEAAESVEPAASEPAAAATSATESAPEEPLEKQLSEADSTADLIAMIDQAAQKRGGGKEALQQIVDATESDRSDVRWHAARAIGMVGEDAIAEMPVLIKLLADEDAVVAAQAASAIAMVRDDDDRSNDELDDAAKTHYAEATKALVKRIVHPDARVRRVSILALSKLAPPVDMIVPLVAKQLADEDPSVVMPALHTMADAGSAAVPFLIESLSEPKSRYWASVVLAEIGPEAGPAVPALLQIAEAADGEPEERMQAILALAAIGGRATSSSEVKRSLPMFRRRNLRGRLAVAWCMR